MRSGLIYFVAFAVLSASTSHTEESTKPYIPKSALEGSNVYLEDIEFGSLEWELRLNGVLQPQGIVQVGAEVSGKIVDVLVEEGDAVQAGEIIARIDKRALQNNLDSAINLYNARHSQLKIEQINLSLLRENLERRESVGFRDQLVSAEEVENLKHRIEISKLQIEVARSNLLQSEAELSEVERLLANTDITAPTSGTIMRSNVNAGETINASQRTPILFEISSLNDGLRLFTEVSQRDISYIEKGSELQFVLKGQADNLYRAYVDRISRNAIHREGEVFFGVYAEVSGASDMLWGGMLVDAYLPLSTDDADPIIPVNAFLFEPNEKPNSPRSHRDGFSPLWVMDAEGNMVERSVRVGKSNDVQLQILEGDLTPGDRIIVGQTF